VTGHRSCRSRCATLRSAPLALLALAGAACASGRTGPARAPEFPDRVVRLEIAVHGLRNGRGWIRGAVFASAGGFPAEHERAVRRAEAPALDGVILLFEDLPAGRYALAVLHDEDADGRMARNALGIPREGYALSGEETLLPRFADAVTDLASPLCRVALRLKYWGP